MLGFVAGFGIDAFVGIVVGAGYAITNYFNKNKQPFHVMDNQDFDI